MVRCLSMDKPIKWFTTQMRIRDTTHEYLKAQAKRSGISITLAAQAILDHAATEGWEVGKVRVVKSPSIAVREQEQAGPSSTL